MGDCPKCSSALDENPCNARRHRCGGCNAVWILEADLMEYVRRCLKREGLESQIVALQEAPTGRPPLRCPRCEKPTLQQVKLRAVKAAKCDGCSGILLEAGAAELLAERVLVSANEWTSGRQLTGNLKLDEILSNPSRYGNPM